MCAGEPSAPPLIGERGGFGRPFSFARSRCFRPNLTALMYRVIVVQPIRCKALARLSAAWRAATKACRQPHGARPVLSRLGRGRLSGRPFCMSRRNKNGAAVLTHLRPLPSRPVRALFRLASGILREAIGVRPLNVARPADVRAVRFTSTFMSVDRIQ